MAIAGSSVAPKNASAMKARLSDAMSKLGKSTHMYVNRRPTNIRNRKLDKTKIIRRPWGECCGLIHDPLDGVHESLEETTQGVTPEGQNKFHMSRETTTAAHKMIRVKFHAEMYS